MSTRVFRGEVIGSHMANISRISDHDVFDSFPPLEIWPSKGTFSGKSLLKGVAVTTLVRPYATTTADSLLPSTTPLQLIDQDGQTGDNPGGLSLPKPDVLRDLHRYMVLGRRFDTQATALTRQGRLAVYPSSRGQDACQVGAVLALRDQDWLFPTYRDSVAILTRGVPAEETLTLLRGDWHCGYDPYEHRVAPQCTPLATSTLHAVGLAHAARLRKQDQVALALLGDGATSEGDTHEALNFASVWKAPVVFLVQNNGYAISVPLAKQTAAPTLAAKGIGYGVPSLLIDGNDAAAVYAAVRAGVERAAAGGGPTLIEAITYRIEAHTNADDATRYRATEEVSTWLERDPITRLEAYLKDSGLLDDAAAGQLAAEAERLAEDIRQRMNADARLDPAELFEHVYAQPTAALERQRAALLAELQEPAEPEERGR
jgi:2-oxoisovalerate dehydrogenase E1 component subunit alpha